MNNKCHVWFCPGNFDGANDDQLGDLRVLDPTVPSDKSTRSFVRCFRRSIEIR